MYASYRNVVTSKKKKQILYTIFYEEFCKSKAILFLNSIEIEHQKSEEL